MAVTGVVLQRSVVLCNIELVVAVITYHIGIGRAYGIPVLRVLISSTLQHPHPNDLQL